VIDTTLPREARPARPGSGPLPAVAGPAPGHDARGLRSRVLRVPLLYKLVFLDLGINLLALWIVQGAPPEMSTEILIASIVVTILINAALVYWALLPLRTLQATASRVSHGDLSARVPENPLADRDISRIGETLNELLDGVTADQIRMRALASQVIGAGDEERAHIARELHDSTAQSLSALEMLVTSTVRELPPGPLLDRLHVMHEIVREALSEVRTLSHNVHPRVLDDLGLVAALEFLVRRTREQSGIPSRVHSDVRVAVPVPVASVLYRVAQEALRNATRHARPTTLAVDIAALDGVARLVVQDDGSGFDVGAAEAERRGMGLFVMRERLALVDGTLVIESVPGSGTTIRADVPLDPPPRRRA
jgi:signal transduction histidine kinase